MSHVYIEIEENDVHKEIDSIRSAHLHKNGSNIITSANNKDESQDCRLFLVDDDVVLFDGLRAFYHEIDSNQLKHFHPGQC